MKYNINQDQPKFEYSNLIKIVSVLSWTILLIVANANNFLIEAFLFSVALTYIAYYVINRGSKQNDEITKVLRTGKQPTKQNRDGYLNVFFASEMETSI